MVQTLEANKSKSSQKWGYLNIDPPPGDNAQEILDGKICDA